MKKIFSLLLVLLVAGVITSFSQNDSNLNPIIEKSFKKEFPGAEFVKWTETQDYQKVDFVLMDQRFEAFFGNDGKLIETRRDLIYNQLPLAIMKELGNSFPNADFSAIEEINNNNGTKYSLSAETIKRKYKLIATADGIISVIERSKK